MLCVQLCVKEDTAAQLIGFMVEVRIVAKQIKDDHTRDVLLSEKEWEELRVAFNIAPSPEPNGRPSKWRDHLYDDAIKVVLHERRGSVSLLQRVFGIGYGRAARLIGFMAEDGIVGEAKERGGESRDVLLTEEQWNAKKSA
jgi:S-DNA-T family DNA segregation ATPase FtsK/SpoIIIE